MTERAPVQKFAVVSESFKENIPKQELKDCINFQSITSQSTKNSNQLPFLSGKEEHNILKY
jgi:hypothetical protein